MVIKFFLSLSILSVSCLSGMKPGEINPSKEELERAKTILNAKERYAIFSPFLKDECVKATADNIKEEIEICEGIKLSLELAASGMAKGWLFDSNEKEQFRPYGYLRDRPDRPEFLCNSIDKLFLKKQKELYKREEDFQTFKHREINQMLAIRSAAMRQWYFTRTGEAFWSSIYLIPKYFWHAIDKMTPDTYEKYERRNKLSFKKDTQES